MSSPSLPVQTAPKKRSKLPLLLIATCFFAPVIAAWFLQSPLSDYKPAPTKNQGELIAPVVPVDLSAFEVVQSIPRSNAEAQWMMLYIPSDACGSCDERLQLLAHIRQATGRSIDRVNLQIVSNRPFLLPKEAQFNAVKTDDAALLLMKQQLGLKADGGLVIVDPLGNAVMRFGSDFDGTKVRKDLTRLLKVSQTGKSQSSGVMS